MPGQVFRIHSLYAGHGDCLWIEYGDAESPHRVVVDCGTAGTYAALKKVIDSVQGMPGQNELLVITHVDADHIAGALPLLADPKNAKLFKDVWFNGRSHLEPSGGLEPFGAAQGESLSRSLLDNGLPWNSAYGFRSISLEEDGRPKRLNLPGGAVVTILSPSWAKLRAMKYKWDSEVKAAGLDSIADAPEPQPIPPGFEAFGFDVDALADFAFDEDGAEANGSSIALLLEYGGKSMLLGADAHPSVLVGALQQIAGEAGLTVDLLKVPHHGSQRNTSKALLDVVRCKVALFSSNGAYYRHPDKEAVARVIKYSPPGVHLAFNCRTKFNEMWDADELRNDWSYSTTYGVGEEGVSVHLL
ncbi:MBL fold metallo-hydrolase [Rugamonas sp. A1-17]|nr:MBL fold metallo-hydrolase [Rugamonas sp. A1-17]